MKGANGEDGRARKALSDEPHCVIFGPLLAGGTWERPTGARRWLCARVRPPAPLIPEGRPRNKRRMEVRSAPGPAITRAGGIKSNEDDVRS
jgi:hypothetical protein